MKERLLYDKTIKIEFNENNHRYLINGKPGSGISVTAATGCLDKPALKFWSVKMMKEHLISWLDLTEAFSQELLREQIEIGAKAHTKFKDEAATMGSLVHDFAENYIKYELGIVKEKMVIDKKADERVKNGILAFLQWVDEHKIKFIASEQLLYSKKHKYFGLADCIAKVDGKMTLVDFKTSNYLGIDYYAQAAAYAFADSEESGREYHQVMIAKFNKETGDFEVVIRDKEQMKEDYKAFLGLLAVKEWSKKYEKPFIKPNA